MTYRLGITAISALLSGLSVPATAQERTKLPDFSYSEGVKGGDCKIAFRAKDGVTMVDFGIGFMDSIFSVEVVKPRWEIVDGKDRSVRNLPITVVFNTGQSTASETGGYKSGLYQGVWGLWHEDNSNVIQSQRGLEALMEASSAKVSFGGEVVADVNLGPKGFAANKLLDCAFAERDKQENQ